MPASASAGIKGVHHRRWAKNTNLWSTRSWHLAFSWRTLLFSQRIQLVKSEDLNVFLEFFSKGVGKSPGTHSQKAESALKRPLGIVFKHLPAPVAFTISQRGIRCCEKPKNGEVTGSQFQGHLTGQYRKKMPSRDHVENARTIHRMHEGLCCLPVLEVSA